eukprot:2397919-Prymnesium_polylepis.1
MRLEAERAAVRPPAERSNPKGRIEPKGARRGRGAWWASARIERTHAHTRPFLTCGFAFLTRHRFPNAAPPS